MTPPIGTSTRTRAAGVAHALTAISERDEEQQLIFKSGTSFRPCHFEGYRYSADLDFSLTSGVDVEGATRLITEAPVSRQEQVGLPVGVRP